VEQRLRRGHVFDLDAIASALAGLPSTPPGLAPGANDGGSGSDDVARRMLQGYAYVDALLQSGGDPFVLGGSRLLLEMNHQVLCGASPERRAEFARHLTATEQRFYEDHLAGADAFYDWAARSRGLEPAAFAARVYCRIVAVPQLFIEGNQRTAALVASFVLGKAGLPPLVATAHTFTTLRALSATCKATDRRSLLSSLGLGWLLDLRMERFIVRTADRRFLGDDRQRTGKS
jgi:hypothetical protein